MDVLLQKTVVLRELCDDFRYRSLHDRLLAEDPEYEARIVLVLEILDRSQLPEHRRHDRRRPVSLAPRPLGHLRSRLLEHREPVQQHGMPLTRPGAVPFREILATGIEKEAYAVFLGLEDVDYLELVRPAHRIESLWGH